MSPFLITTKRPVAPLTRDFPDSSSIVAEHVSRRAVATLEEAQEDAAQLIGDTLADYYAKPGADWTGRKAITEAAVDAAFALTESGGTISLPDGTTIEVEPVGWTTLYEQLRPFPREKPLMDWTAAEIIDAYNAAQETSVVTCSHCTDGTITGPNGSRWRCTHCAGTGRATA